MDFGDIPDCVGTWTLDLPRIKAKGLFCVILHFYCLLCNYLNPKKFKGSIIIAWTRSPHSVSFLFCAISS